MKSKFINRYKELSVTADLEDRMVFIGGPRQVGKTTFALQFLSEPSPRHPGYISWDDPMDRNRLIRGELPSNEPVIVIDEIHKFAGWRNLIKGFFDKQRHDRRFIVTGSARLDLYSRGGDSLLGRYRFHRLHPITLPEMPSPDLSRLLRFGGFPEPLLKGKQAFLNRWHLELRRQVIETDIRDLETVREIGLLELLADELPRKVGSPLSLASLRDALEVSHASIRRWIEIFERLYYCYRIPPYGTPRIRAVKKEQKLYLYDWSLVPDPGPRFENLVASHLLKYCHHVQDTEGHVMDLRFIRDTDRREVDFVVLRDGTPLFAVECKSGERSVSPHVFYFRDRTPIPTFYQVHTGTRDYDKQGVRVLPFQRFCDTLSLV